MTTSIVRVLVACLIGIGATTSLCDAARIVERLCIDDLIDRPWIDFDIPDVPVGCEQIDCCPGCPGPPFDLEWEITVQGDGLAGMILEFDSSDPDALAQVLSGEARKFLVEKSTLRIPLGTTKLRGLLTDNKMLVTFQPRLMLDAAGIRKMYSLVPQHVEAMKKLDSDIEDAPFRTGRFIFRQTIADRIINELIIDLDIVICPGTPEPPCGDYTWRNLGPNHISGAMRQIVIDTSDRRSLFAVSANGGIWRLDNIGDYPSRDWRPLTDRLGNLRFRTMAVAPSDGRVLYGATSLKLLRGTSTIVTSEIFRSTDRGAAWQEIHQPGMGVVHRLWVHPANTDVVLAATSTGLWRQSNTVASWSQLYSGDCLDVAVDPDDSSVVYLGVRGEGIYKSFTAGADWSSAPVLNYDSTVSNIDSISIALGSRDASGNPQDSTARSIVVRFGTEVCVSHLSGDGAAGTWQRGVPFIANANDPTVNDALGALWGGNVRRSDLDPRQSEEWSFCVAIDPFDPMHLLVGSVGLLESTDGGATWSSRSIPHEDEHWIEFDPEVQDLVYLASDGGIFSSINGGSTWPSMSLAHTVPATTRGTNYAVGLVTSEFRHGFVSEGLCIGTTDHTGFVLTDDFDDRWQFLFNGPDRSARHAHETTFVFPDSDTDQRIYAINMRRGDDPQNRTGRLAQLDLEMSNGFIDVPAFQFLSDEIASIPDTGLYFPETGIYQRNVPGPFAMRADDTERLVLLGAQNPNGSGSIIRAIRLPLDDVAPIDSTIEATHSEPFYAICFHPDDDDRAFAITSDGELFERDFSTTGAFTSLGQWSIPSDDLFVSRLLVQAETDLAIYALSQSAVGRFDYASMSWATIYTSSDINETFISLAIHPIRHETFALGTSRGIYHSSDGGTSWHPFQGRVPAVPVTELHFDSVYLYALTYGRGVWRCRPCP